MSSLYPSSRRILARATICLLLLAIISQCPRGVECRRAGARDAVGIRSMTRRSSPDYLVASPVSSTGEIQPTTSTTSSASPSPNVVVQMASYVKSSITKTIDGCGEMWSNHGKCKEIRKKMQDHRDFVKEQWQNNQDIDVTASEVKQELQKLQGGITYEEYMFLQKGKEDRGKLLNLVFLMWGAPRFLPYALMFNPDMLPSPFKNTDSTTTGESIWQKQSRERSSAVIQTLLSLEREARATPALAKLNIFGRKQQEARKLQLSSLITTTSQVMSSNLDSSKTGAQYALDLIGDQLYRSDEDFTRADQRLVSVPKCVVKGMANLLNGAGGGGFLGGLQPHFMTRGRVVGHLRKISDSDDFLVQAQIDLATIPKRLLVEACSERCMPCSSSREPIDEGELRQQLQDWLDLVVHEPSERIADVASRQNLFYNGNLARFALMSYYSCVATCDDRSSLVLPKLLYTASAPSVKASESIKNPSSRSEDAGSSRKKGFRPFRRMS